jgi:hypothetical protein
MLLSTFRQDFNLNRTLKRRMAQSVSSISFLICRSLKLGRCQVNFIDAFLAVALLEVQMNDSLQDYRLALH